jgi:hypothetical protein
MVPDPNEPLDPKERAAYARYRRWRERAFGDDRVPVSGRALAAAESAAAVAALAFFAWESYRGRGYSFAAIAVLLLGAVGVPALLHRHFRPK